MNKFKEFDHVKTPSDWKNIDLTQPKRKKNYHLQSSFLVISVIVVCSFIGLIYVYHNDIYQWMQSLFDNKEIEIVKPQEEREKKWQIEGNFLYDYHVVNDQNRIDEVYAFIDGKFVKKDISHKSGEYQSKPYSFDYVQYDDYIFTFNQTGFFQYSLQLMKGDLVYFGSQDHNLCTLNMKTDDIKTITNDQKSANFAISPNGKYILINKFDKYWTVYNTNTHIEKKIDAMNPYAHSNEYSFYKENDLITFNSRDETVLIHLDTFKTNNMKVTCLYPMASSMTIDFDDNETIITNHLDSKVFKINMNLQNYEYAIQQNRYLMFDSKDDKQMIFVDFEKQEYKVIKYLNEKVYQTGFDILQKHYIITYYQQNNQNYYEILSLEDIFS